jgi:stage V sporulation protein S
MNRFFSKLDLRDIKIDPRTSRFLPDAEDESNEDAEPGSNHQAQPAPETPQPLVAETLANGEVAEPVAAHSDRPRYVPSWAAAQTPVAETAAEAPGRAATATLAPVAVAEELGVDGEVTVQRSQEGQVEVLKVSARSRPSAVAGAIAGVVRENGRAEVQAIGAGATNQAVKAVAIARDYLRETGIEAICLPAFIDVTIENEDRTAIRLVVEPR